jgi:molecular chaperone DnaK (HSP70)
VLLVSYLILSSNSSIGVDIGSAKSVLAAVRKRGIDIILSDSSNKSIP